MTETKYKTKVGDIVKLKSGGPWMTIQDYENAGYVLDRTAKTKWFSLSGELEWGTFIESSLTKK